MDQPSLPIGLQSPPRLPYGGSKSRGLMSPAMYVGADGIAMTPVRSGSLPNLGAGQTLLQEGTGVTPGSPLGALYSPGMVAASPLRKAKKLQSSAERNEPDAQLATPLGKQSAGLLSPSRSPGGNPYLSSAGLMLLPSSTSMGLHATGSSALDVTASPGLGLGLSGATASLRQGMYAGTTVSSASQRLLFDDSDLHVPYSSLDPRAGSDTGVGAGLGADTAPHRSAARMGRLGAPDALQGLERRADGRYEKKLSIVPDGTGEECGTEGDVAASHCQFESNTEFSEARSTARQLHQGWAGSKGLMYSAGPELGRAASYMTRSSTGPAALPLAIGKELVPSAFYGQASHRARRAVAAALPTFHSNRSVTAVRAAKAENAEPPSTFALHTLRSTGRPITIGRVQEEKGRAGSEVRPIQGTSRARRMYEAALAQVEGASGRAGGSSSSGSAGEGARAGDKGGATKARTALPLKGLGTVLGGPKASIVLPTADEREPDSSHSRGRCKSADKHAARGSSAGGGGTARDSVPSSPRSHRSGTSGVSRFSAPGSGQRSITSSGLATTERLAGLKRKMSLISTSGGSASGSGAVGHRVGPDAVQMEMTLARNGPRIIAQVSASMQKQFAQPIDYCTGEVIQTVQLTDTAEKGGEQGDESAEGGPAPLHTPAYGSTAAPVHTAVADDDPRLLGNAEFQSNPSVVCLESHVHGQAPLPFALSAMGPPGSAGAERERQLQAELLRIRTQQLLQPLQPLQLAIASSGAHATTGATGAVVPSADADQEHASGSPAAPPPPSALAGAQALAPATSLITPDRTAVGSSTSRATEATAGRPVSSRGASKGAEGEGAAAAPPAPRKEARKEKRFVLAEVSDGRRKIIFTTKEQPV